MSIRLFLIIIIILFSCCSKSDNPFNIKRINVNSVIIVEQQEFNAKLIEHKLNDKQIKILVDNLTNLSSKDQIKVKPNYRIIILCNDGTMINLISIDDKVAMEVNDYYSYPEDFHLGDLLKLN